jgi:hypothetical protein
MGDMYLKEKSFYESGVPWASKGKDVLWNSTLCGSP